MSTGVVAPYEIDIVTKGGNYGWNLKEGEFRFDPENGTVSNDLTDLPENMVDPVAQYDHNEGISIIGGFIYRGQAIPELFGKYVFGDFSLGFQNPSGRLFYADLDIGLVNELTIGTDDRALNLFCPAMKSPSTLPQIYLCPAKEKK